MSAASAQKLSPVHALRILAFHSGKPDLVLEKNEAHEGRKAFVKMLLTSILDDEISRRTPDEQRAIHVNPDNARLFALAGDILRENAKDLTLFLTANILDTLATVCAENLSVRLTKPKNGGVEYLFDVPTIPSLSGEKPIELLMRIEFAGEPQKNKPILQMANAVVKDTLLAVDHGTNKELLDNLTKQTIFRLKNALPEVSKSLSLKIETHVRPVIQHVLDGIQKAIPPENRKPGAPSS